MISNSSGPKFATTPQATMAAFDSLPPTARRALANAAFDWSPQQVLARHRRVERGFKTGPEIAQTFANRDRADHEKDAKLGIVPPVSRHSSFQLGALLP